MTSSLAHASPSAITQWYARFSTFKGDTTCAYGAPDCNRCVFNVRQQFKDLTQTAKSRVSINTWSYGSSSTVDSILTDLASSGHFQGFTRLPTDGQGIPNFVATFGEGTMAHAGIFGIKDTAAYAGGPAGSGSLQTLFTPAAPHPGGAQGIGHYVLVGTQGTSSTLNGTVDVLDLSKGSVPPVNRAVLPLSGIPAHNKQGVSGIGVTRLAGGGYLLLSDLASNYNGYMFWYTPTLDNIRPELIYQTPTIAGANSGISGWDGFENVTLVNECGTGKIFAIGASAPELASGQITYSRQSSAWVLFEVVGDAANSTIDLQFRERNTQAMFSAACDERAAGSVFAGSDGELVLYCQQKQRSVSARPDGLACGTSAAIAGATTFFDALLPGLGAAAAQAAIGFCSKSLKDQNAPEAFFTEYWPTQIYDPNPPAGNKGVPPTPANIAVTVKSSTLNAQTAVLEANTGRVCSTSTNTAVTCNWTIDPGTQVLLIPLWGSSGPAARWTSNCTDRNTGANTTAIECQRAAASGAMLAATLTGL